MGRVEGDLDWVQTGRMCWPNFHYPSLGQTQRIGSNLSMKMTKHFLRMTYQFI